MLLGNGSVLLKSSGKWIGGPAPAYIQFQLMSADFSQARFFAAGSFDKKCAVPNGYLHPYAWRMPSTGGGMSCYRNIKDRGYFTNARGANGLNASITMTDLGQFTQAIGELIASGSVTITAHTVINSASLAGSIYGAATISATSTVQSAIGALAGLTTLILCEGSLTLDPYAKGYMDAIIQQATSDMTPAAVADAVWNAVAASYNTTGTMGEKLNGAGSAGNPWTEVIEGGLSAADVLRLILAIQTGVTSIVDHGGGSATVDFMSVDGTVKRITAEMDESERISVTLDGA
jgi:hypothetical protein